MGDADKVRNKFDEGVGAAKEKAGQVTGDEQLEAEGKGDKAEARLKDAGEKVKDAASDAVDNIKDAAAKVKDAFTDR